MNLILKKPLCFFDVEATGLQITTDRIVQIAIIKLTVDGEQEELNELINPEIIIADEIIAIHSISNEKVANAPTFKQLAQKIADFIGIRHKMFLSHSYDHRVVDGALGGQFVRRVADYLEAFDGNREV